MSRNLIGTLLLAIASTATAGVIPADQAEFFESHIRPLLVSKCYGCHGAPRSGGLRLDSEESLLQGGMSGPVVVPGKPEQSLLVQRVKEQDGSRRMPMGGSLTASEIADLEKWIAMGAPWPESSAKSGSLKSTAALTPEQKNFWAFRPIKKVEVPLVPNGSKSKSPIDAFVLEKLGEKEMKQARPATKAELIRRATFDLTGLPPTPSDVDAFISDKSPKAYAKLVDRLLASPHYGERWGRYWLDVARYGEDDVRGALPAGYELYENAFRYRDWVIQAFNADMPYDLFVKAQLAGDLLNRPDKEKLIGGLGLLGLGPWYYDLADAPQARANERHDRVDLVTRGFLGLTGGCARCHDHKYDPISSKDYYALAGVFASTDYREYPLVPQSAVDEYKAKEKFVKDQEAAIKEFSTAKSLELGELMTHKTARYVFAAWKVLGPAKSTVANEAQRASLDTETLERWTDYLKMPHMGRGYLKTWDELLARGGTKPEAQQVADNLQAQVLATVKEKKSVDEYNKRVLGEAREKRGAPFAYLPNGFGLYDGDTDNCFGVSVVVKSLDREKYLLWSDLLFEREGLNGTKKQPGVFLFKDDQLTRFLSPEYKEYFHEQQDELAALKKQLPAKYPYLQIVSEGSRIGNLKQNLRGSPYNLGEEAPRRLLAVLYTGEPKPFKQGSGRLEMAEMIASHPLAARVMVNRIWQHHFGRGIVGTSSNFGQMGDRPSEPDLLEYLAGRFVESGYSVKQMHREIMLSSTYQLSTEYSRENFDKDPENHLFWRANRQRLDAEAIRDSLLFVAGNLDASVGGPPQTLDLKNVRRSVYGKVSRFKMDPLMSLFDFPDPGTTSEQRNATNVPLQGLFFLNSPLVAQQAQRLSDTLAARAGRGDSERIHLAYRVLFGREVSDEELRLGHQFLAAGKSDSAWHQYAQALLSSNEFVFVN